MSSHSSKKDKITTDNTSEERERVRSEQEYLKQKGKEVASSVKQAKDGNISMPTTETITSALQHGQESLTNLQSSDRGQKISPGGEKVPLSFSLFIFLLYINNLPITSSS